MVITTTMRRPPRRRVQTRNGGPTMLTGDRIRLNVPENAQLHGTEATVTQLTEWGAYVDAPAAATGQFRALWSEMEPAVEYAGECCTTCGSINMIRTGACKTCQDCGSAGGCG